MDGDSFCGALDDSEAQEKCANCGRWFPPTRLVMHERQCARNAKRCEQCGVVVPALSEEKHRAIHHVALQCGYGCGACKVQLELHEHQVRAEMRARARARPPWRGLGAHAPAWAWCSCPGSALWRSCSARICGAVCA